MFFTTLVSHSVYLLSLLLIIVPGYALGDYQPADKIIEKKLEINGVFVPKCYVLRPRDSFTYVISEYAYVGTGYCSTSEFNWSFDINGRISTNVKGIDYCITAPSNVIKEKVLLEYVKVFRCDMGNKYQQWYATEDNRIKSLIGDYALQSYNSNVYISREKGHYYEDVLTSDMDNWIKNLSIPRSYNFSLSMNWHFGEKPYFANYRADKYLSFRASSDDSYRVLYSPYKKSLSFQHMSGENESVAYCLESLSQKGDKTWRYVELSAATECPNVQTEEPLPSNMQWRMVVSSLPENANERATVKFYDQWGNSLRVWETGGAWGLGFTIPDEAIENYEYVTTAATDTFYVDRDVAEWSIFEAANQQQRAQFCPAPSINPLKEDENFASTTENFLPRILPSGFTLTPAWYDRLWKIAASNAGGSIPGIGICGTCLMETFAIIREFYESDPQMEPTGVNHYFDPALSASIVDQFASNFPDIYTSLENAMQLAQAEINALTNLFNQGQISQASYIIDFNTRVFQLIVEAANQILPDYYQTTPTALPFLGYTDLLRDQINDYFAQASVGTTAVVSMQVTLLDGTTSGHSMPLIRLNNGWVVIEVANQFAARPAVDFFNQARFTTPADAVFHYYQNRNPYTINGQNNIAFHVGDFLLFTQVNVRPSVIMRNPSVSFGNCTGEGEDGKRGTGQEKEPQDLVQNRCIFKYGGTGRCYGHSESINDILPSKKSLIIYEHNDQKGRALEVTESIPYVGDEFNDIMSSWSMPAGWHVRFYEHENYQGKYYTISDIKGNADKFNDQVSSIKILMPSKSSLTIYEHNDQKGRALEVTESIPYVGDEFNDIMSSWSMPAGWHVRFYEHENYQGKYYTISDIKGNADKFNDQVSSIKIFKN